MWWAGFKTPLRRTAPRQVYLSLDFAEVLNPEDPATTTSGALSPRITAPSWPAVLDLCHPEQDNRFAPKRRTSVWLSGALARPFWLPAIEGVSSRQELTHIAQDQAAEATGLAAPCSVWISPHWTPQQGGLAAAVEESVLNALQAWTKQQGCALTGIRPWWNMALNQHWQQVSHTATQATQGSTAVVCLEDEQALMMFGHDSTGQLCQVACYWPRPDPVVRHGLIKRQQWSLNTSLSADTPVATVLLGQRSPLINNQRDLAATVWETVAP